MFDYFEYTKEIITLEREKNEYELRVEEIAKDKAKKQLVNVDENYSEFLLEELNKKICDELLAEKKKEFDNKRFLIDKKYGVIYKEVHAYGTYYLLNEIIILDDRINNYFEGQRYVDHNNDLINEFLEQNKEFIDGFLNYGDLGFYRVSNLKIEKLKELISDLPKTIDEYQLPNSGIVIDGDMTEFYFNDFVNERAFYLWTTNEDHLTWINNIKKIDKAYNGEIDLHFEDEFSEIHRNFEWYKQHSIAISKPLRLINKINKFFLE